MTITQTSSRMGGKKKLPIWMGAVDCDPLPSKDWTNLKVLPEYKLTIYVKESMLVDNVSKILRYKRKMDKIYKEVVIVVI
jgi:hypothetical protein